MRCDACGSDNREGRKFCSECGVSLAVACPSCGAANEPDDKFCGECGSTISSVPGAAPVPAGAAPERSEQRYVSVLFADMVGYTTLSEGRDSEDVRNLLTRYFDRAREIIERFGGSVEKFIGDAVMGVWGATAAREDDAQRAVRAALELVDMVAALGDEAGIPELRLRAGVNSGQTSVGPGGNEKGLVVGDLVNVASRLESLAAPGTVNVGAATEAVSNRAIDYESLGEQRLKGKTEGVAVWRALRVAGMVGGRGDDVRHPPFIGRGRELRLLKDALAGVEADQRSRLVSIIGEAGIGKTRLAEEFRNHIDGYSQSIYWHWGRSPSYGEGVTFWALGEMVRRRAGILEGEDGARSRTRLRTTIAEFVPSEEDRQWLEPRLSGLLGLAEMPAGTQSELFAALRSFFQHIATQGTTVLVFEDMHWADPGLVEFVAELVERSARSPILVVTLARPDLLEEIPSWGTQHRSSMAARLSPLSDGEMTDLIEQYVPGVGDDVVQRLVERSTGFPLYAVELVRMLTASGELQGDGQGYRYEGDPSEMALPDTVQTVIGARLDRLDADQRTLLQDGSVLGQAFSLGALVELRGSTPEALEAELGPLVQLELLEIEDDPRSPERGRYRFVQSLIHEVAYRRLTRSDRRGKHLAAAAYLAERGDAESAGLVARHYMGAYEATPDGPEKSEMVARAIESLTDAGDRAVELHSHQRAIELYEEAIEIAPDESHRAEQRIKAAWAAGLNSDLDRGLAHLEVAGAHFESVDDLNGVRRIATAVAEMYNSHFRSDRALEAIRDVYEGIEQIDDPISLRVVAEAARALSLTSHLTEAIEATDLLLPATAEQGEVELALQALVTRATALAWLNRRIEAYAILRGVAEEAEIRGLVEPAGRALNNLTSIVEERSPREAGRISQRLGAVISRSQQASWMLRHSYQLALWAVDDGEYDKGLALLNDFPEDDLTPFWQAAFAFFRHRVDVCRSGDRASFDGSLEAVAFFDDEADLQMRAAWDGNRARVCADFGDWEGAYSSAMQVGGALAYHGLAIALTAAAWMDDADKARAAADRFTEAPNPLPGIDMYAEAIVAALAGDTATASTLFTRVIEAWKIRLLGHQIAEAQVTFARLVGVEDPSAAQAAQEARQWITSSGGLALLDVWADGLPPGASSEAAAV